MVRCNRCRCGVRGLGWGVCKREELASKQKIKKIPVQVRAACCVARIGKSHFASLHDTSLHIMPLVFQKHARDGYPGRNRRRLFEQSLAFWTAISFPLRAVIRSLLDHFAASIQEYVLMDPPVVWGTFPYLFRSRSGTWRSFLVMIMVRASSSWSVLGVEHWLCLGKTNSQLGDKFRVEVVLK